MSIDLIIGRDHVKVMLRVITNLNEKITPGRNRTIISILSYAQFKKKYGEILGNAAMEK